MKMKGDWLNTYMTIKPARTKYSSENQEEKIRFLKREQEEREAKRSLQDFLKHMKEELDDGDFPPSPLRWPTKKH